MDSQWEKPGDFDGFDTTVDHTQIVLNETGNVSQIKEEGVKEEIELVNVNMNTSN